jgi:hypothetical protein
MSARTLATLYDRLTGAERFHAALAAKARDDDTELDRLRRTAPYGTYRMQEADWLDRWESSQLLTLMWALVWTRAHRDWVIVSTLSELPPGALQRFEHPDLAGVSLLAAEMAGVHEGLIRFCGMAGIDCMMLLRAWCPPVADDVEGAAALLADWRRLATSLPTCELASLARWRDVATSMATTLEALGSALLPVGPLGR